MSSSQEIRLSRYIRAESVCTLCTDREKLLTIRPDIIVYSSFHSRHGSERILPDTIASNSFGGIAAFYLHLNHINAMTWHDDCMKQ